ncbi:MAG TPA: PrgI family protein [Patescibacteria group bacterium]
MDNHPIPQDVTGFQFRLIGDMTIKQFAYLATGVGLSWIIFILPTSFFIKFPLIILLSGLGVILAFIPIEGRPADTMIMFFFKALFSPSQYSYQQTGGSLPTQKPDEKVTVQEQTQKKEEQEKKEEKVKIDATFLPLANSVLQPDKTESMAHTMPIAVQNQPSPQQPNLPQENSSQLPSEESSPQELSKEATQLVKELQEAKSEETKAQEGTQAAEEAHKKVSQLEDDLQTILEQKQDLERQLMELQKQLAQKNQQVFTPTNAQDTPRETSHVIKVAPNQKAAVGTPLTNDVPNLISGVVKDPRSNVLPNILIEVKDKDDNPVRAFKTNPLGQFASATPVISGVYTITFEDPQGKQKFDTVEITANGTVLPQLEVFSVDQREELRRELFGGQT